MSQLPLNPGMYAEETLSEPPRISGLAIAALVCAVVGFCVPGLGLLGLILGLVAIVLMIGRQHLRGKGLAIAAIVLGLIASAAWAAVGWWGYNLGRYFVVMIGETPMQTVKAGYAGDYATFRSHLLGASTQQDDAAIAAFIDSLRGRWGTLTALEMVPNQRQQPTPPPGSQAANIEFEYTAKFDSTDVPVVVEFRVEPHQPGAAAPQKSTFGMPFNMGISSFTFKDRDRGDIRFPVLPKPPKGGEADTAPADGAGEPADGASGAGSAGKAGTE